MKELSFYPDSNSGMYCEKISPDEIQHEECIIMIHGGAHTGSCFKSTPDKRDGWAYYFAEKGFEVFIPDWPGSGRSGYIPPDKINGKFAVDAFSKLVDSIDGKVILITHSMGGAFGWKLAETRSDRITKVIGVAPAPMGNVQEISEIVRRSDNKLTVNFLGREIDLNMDKPYVCDSDFIYKKLIGENSRFFPRDFTENYVSSIQTISPNLFYERFNTNSSQLKIDDVSKLKNIKFMVISATEDIDHTQDLDKRIVTFLKENGICADFIYLGDLNINGNGHMFMLEKNNMEIADVIYDWIRNS